MEPRIPFSALLAGLLAMSPAGAQDEETLEPVTVTAPRLERPLAETPAAVTRVEGEERRAGRPGRTLDEGLEGVPGLYFQNRHNFAQGLRISSRGFGARAAFGIRGLRLRQDGLPLTLPDGQSQVDTVDLDAVESVEVRRGPASVLYGNATGGVIDLRTAEGFAMERSPVVRLQAGSHAMRKANVRAGGTRGDWGYHASATAFAQDGHREQSAAEKYLARGSATGRFAGGRELRLIAGAMDTPFAEDPGGLTREELEADPGQADPDAVTLDAGQSVDQQDLGAVWTDPASLPGELTARAFASRRDFEQQLPFYFEQDGEPAAENRVGYRRWFYGTRLEYADEGTWGAVPVEGVVGVDVDRQEDDRVRHVVDEERTVREQTVDERQTATAAGLFSRVGMAVTDATGITLGLRVDRLRLAIDDHLADPVDDSGARTFTETSVGLGLTHAVGDHTFYANLTTAFESPTFVELADPAGGGGFNPDLEPQRAVNRELGVRGPVGTLGAYDLALFSVRVRDELVPFERDGRTFYENAGATRREGLEAGLELEPAAGWNLRAALTLADYQFTRFRDRAGEDSAGNEIPGLPPYHAGLTLRRSWERGFAEAGLRHAGPTYADNANTAEVDAYTVADLRAGLRWPLPGERLLTLYGGVENLADADYVANVRVNTGPGYFEPAPGRTAYAGVEVGF
ncbi:MAG: TonB-dependent receptor family protein [Thiohalorhabdus sp.]|uniref:TonB-dependent receptor family protein n=1 Tax=Thiohalorhabdus sp. TaxID=3094134 RepID=UPI00397EB6A9